MPSEATKPQLYSTQNLYEGAYCLCQGMKLAGKESSGKKVVIFFGGKDARARALRFYNGGMVEAKAYAEAYRSLKDYVFER